MSLSSGSRLGPYEIVAALGAGGMGEVYRARDTRLGRDVAVKVFRESLAGSSGWERFEREARAASALNHPNICAVYDVGEAAGRPYLVMELLEGQTLREYAGGLPVQPAVVSAFGVQIADALEAAHAKGIIHRDIKAGNIMVTGRGHIKVLDFGLAKYAADAAEADATRTIDSLTAAGTVVGTPHYMAPEILQGKPANVRSDLWALGVVLHEMLSGGLPFQGSTAFEVSSAILREAPPGLPPGVPSRLRSVVEKCLEKQPGKRYESADALRMALAMAPSAASSSGRKPGLWLAGAVAIVALAGFWFWRVQTGSHQPARSTVSTGARSSTVREANEAFEMALFQLNQGNAPKAQQYLERAISLDPHFAVGHQFLAISYDVQLLTGELNDASILYKSEEELRRALQDDPSLIDVHSELAVVAFFQGDRQRALSELNQLSARDPRANGWRITLHFMAEENSAAKELALAILDREPLFQPARNGLVEILLTEGDMANALRHARTISEQAPNAMTGVSSLSWAYISAGELENAQKLMEEKRELLGRNYLWRLTWAVLLALQNKREEALRAMDPDTLKWADANFLVTLRVAEFYALLGNSNEAVAWLDRAVRKGDERAGWFRRDPRLASIRDDPSFQRIVGSIEARRQGGQTR